MLLNLSIKKQFSLNVLANGAVQFVTIATQLVVLPVMLYFWGADRYGAWLIISALPTYMTMANLGFAQISANDMTMRIAKGDKEGAIIVNQTAWMFNIVICLSLLVLLTLFVYFFPISKVFDLKLVPVIDIQIATFFLGIATILTIIFGVVTAAMRSVGLFWLASCTRAASMFASSLILVGTGAFGGGILIAATLTMLAMLIIMSGVSAWFYNAHPEFSPGLKRADGTLVRKLIAPSLSYMSFTLSNAISIQGMSLLVGAFIGPTAVVIVNAIRTLTRLGRTAASVVIHALEPIFAQFAGSGDAKAGRKAYLMLILSALIGTVIYVFGMMLLGTEFLLWWTGGVVHDQVFLFHLMLLAVVLEIFWFTLQTPFVSINRHSLFALWTLGFSIVGVSGAFWLFPYLGIEVAGIAGVFINAGILISTVIMCVRKRHLI